MGAYVHSNLLRYNRKRTGLARFGGVNGYISQTVFTYLNATAHVKFYKEMGSVDNFGFFHSFLKDLKSGEIDFAMNMNIQRTLWKQQTYPHETSGFCIVTLKYPITFMQKFEMVFTVEVWLILGNLLYLSLLKINFSVL